MAFAAAGIKRPALLRRALNLEWFTLGWNLVEGVVALAAAVLAGSVALLGFGMESFVESASAGIIAWRIFAERNARGLDRVERVEARARRLVAVSLVALGLYVLYESATALWFRERPDPSVVGMVVTALSLVVMGWLARVKRRTAVALGSRAMEADAFQTSACFWLSLVVLVGIGLNGAFGWWWADPLAALVVVGLIGVEAKEAWEGEEEDS